MDQQGIQATHGGPTVTMAGPGHTRAFAVSAHGRAIDPNKVNRITTFVLAHRGSPAARSEHRINVVEAVIEAKRMQDHVDADRHRSGS